MNPLISSTSSLFLPLIQLNPHCTRLLNSLHDGRPNQKERILYEQTLWNEVKKIRALNDKSIFIYLIGYYHTILYQSAKLAAQNDLFQYHVLIRLGDLNRYMERNDVAEYYYCNARNLFPYFGHAYNQLGLLIKPVNCYKCCYYYARAARSSDKPLNTIADSNLRIAVAKYNCELLNQILNDPVCPGVAENVGKPTNLPQSAFEWFYVVVIAIYADNILPIAALFLKYLDNNFSTQKATTIRDSVKIVDFHCDRNSYVLLASLDILLDWLKFGSQGKTLFPTISLELRQIKSCLQTFITSYEVDLLHQSNNSTYVTSTLTCMDISSTRVSSNSNLTLQDSSQFSASDSSKSSNCNKKLPALPHDYVLRGFRPLDILHKELQFKMKMKVKGALEDNSIDGLKAESNKFIDANQLLQIMLRIKRKMDAFGPLIRKQTRNIALESILSNMEKSNDL